MRRIAVFLILLTLLCPLSSGLVSTNVPLDHWSYDAVDKLANYGLIESSMLTTKPLSRIEMARHVGQAMDALARRDDPPEILSSILERLTREYRGELIQLGVLDGPYDESFIKPVEDPYVRYLYAKNTPELENRRGDVFQQGSNYRAGFATKAELFGSAAFYLHPEYGYSATTDGDIDLIEAYAKVMAGPFEIQAGKDSLWWGPGYHGSILMSNNAQPFQMLKITNPQPIRLPWIFSNLGPVRAEWFLAELERNRDFPNAKLSGVRVNIKPHPAVELGASRVVIFGGRGAPSVDAWDYAKMFLAVSEQAENNQLAGFDGSIRIPLPKFMPARSIKLYTEAAGEDESGGMPCKWGELVGVQLHDILKTGRTDLRIEYANDHISGYQDLFYTHSLYTSGYTYKGRVIGHHMGTDASDLFVQLSHYLTEDIIVDVAYDRQTHNLGANTHPTTDIYELGVTYFPSPDWQITGGYRYEQARGRDDDNHTIEVGLIRRF